MYSERSLKIAELEKAINKDVYILCHNRRNDEAYIDGTMIDVLRRMVKHSKRRDGAALIIQTPGGDLNESYYIGEFFREYYDYTEAYVVSDCYSGGTIIALSTDKIYLSRSGCLGPIDIQRYNSVSAKDNWYPSLTGNIGALMKAETEGKINEFQKKSFHNSMDVLATYYKEDYTYKALVGENVKKHCVEETEWEKVWEYLAAINISHGIPLSYRKLIALGLKVDRMNSDVESIINSIIRDVEYEFGELREKSVLYDFFNGPDVAAIKPKSRKLMPKSEKNFVSQCSEEECHENSSAKEHIYTFSKTGENLAIIESSVIGFMQSREIGITFEDMRPVFLNVISTGWDEELNDSLVDEEKAEEVKRILGYVLKGSCENLSDLTAEQYSTLLSELYDRVYGMAVQELEDMGHDIENMPSGEVYKMVVEYLINNTELVVFDEKVEKKIRETATREGKDLDSLGAADRIKLYEKIFGEN